MSFALFAAVPMTASATYLVNGAPAGASLQADINALANFPATHTITLTADTTVITGLTAADKTITFDLNGFNLSISNDNGHGLELTNSAIDYAGTGSFTVSSTHAGNPVYALSISGGSAVLTGASINTGPAGVGDAIYAWNGAAVTVNGHVSASGLGDWGVNAYGGSTVTVNGNVTSAGLAINAGNAMGPTSGTVTVTGNVQSNSSMYAITANIDSRVTIGAVGSPVQVTAVGAGIYAADTAEVKVTGNVTASGGSIYAADTAKVEVTGNVEEADSGSVWADGGTIQITGNVTANANPADWFAVDATGSGSAVTIGGNLTTSGIGASAEDSATVTVNGHVTANGVFGVESTDGGEIYIQGTLTTANEYIRFYDQATSTYYFVSKMPYPATQIIGGIDYHVYADNNVPHAYVYIATPVFVTSITVTGAGGATTITNNNGTLQMSADVLPINAANPTVTWSVTNGTGSATISTNGLLRATGNGTVTVTATANDGSGVFGTLLITISGQSGNLGATSIPVMGPVGLLLLALALGVAGIRYRVSGIRK